MIRRIKWAEHQYSEPKSPFGDGNLRRNLRITLHSRSFAEANRWELYAIKVLRAFADHPEVEVLDTEAGNIPQLQVEPADSVSGYGRAFVESLSGRRFCWIHDVGESIRDAKWTAQRESLSKPASASFLDDILLVRAHVAFGQDLFVTLSEPLLKHRDSLLLRDANLCTPTEAARLMGVCLRSQGNTNVMGPEVGHLSLDDEDYYWTLARHRLPRLWKYHSAAVYSDHKSANNLRALSGSVMTRATRALVARDSIGREFYGSRGVFARNSVMYHFDYLMLLLSGAFDAQALVAYHVFNISRKQLRERDVTIRNPKFKENLPKEDAKDLLKILGSAKFQGLSDIVSKLRNTIHRSLQFRLHRRVLGMTQNCPDNFPQPRTPVRGFGVLSWIFSLAGESAFEPVSN